MQTGCLIGLNNQPWLRISDIDVATKPSDFIDIAESHNLSVGFVLRLADYFADNLIGDAATRRNVRNP